MSTAQLDKWTAFAGSLALPGLGQCAAGRWSGAAWLAGAIGLLCAGQQCDLGSSWTGGAMFLLGLASAENAKRFLERRAAVRSVLASRVVLEPPRGRAVSIRLEVDATLTTRQMWERVSDLPDFLTIDPFHERVAVMRDPSAAGSDLALYHNAFGWRFVRFGRILSWHEGTSYAFSDLSRHHRPRHRAAPDALSCQSRRRGFPHVFLIEVAPHGDDGSRLVIHVRGTWTSRLIPQAVARLWLRWVFFEHARLLTKAL